MESSATTSTATTTTNTANINAKPVLRKEKKLVRNLADDLDDENASHYMHYQQHQQQQKPITRSNSNLSAKSTKSTFSFKHLFGLDSDRTPSQASEAMSGRISVASTGTSAYFNKFNTQQQQNHSRAGNANISIDNALY